MSRPVGSGKYRKGINIPFILMAIRGRLRRAWRRSFGFFQRLLGMPLSPKVIMEMHVRMFTTAARFYEYPKLECVVDLFLPGEIDVKAAEWPWRQLLGEKHLRVREIPGVINHLKLIDEPAVVKVSEHIQTAIQRRSKRDQNKS